MFEQFTGHDYLLDMTCSILVMFKWIKHICGDHLWKYTFTTYNTYSWLSWEWVCVLGGCLCSSIDMKIFLWLSSIPLLEKAMATHSSVLAWRIPGMGEPGGLPSMGSHRVGQDWRDWAAAAAVFQCTHIPHLLYPFDFWRHLGWFPVLAIVNSVSVNIRLHVSFLNCGFLWLYAQ